MNFSNFFFQSKFLFFFLLRLKFTSQIFFFIHFWFFNKKSTDRCCRFYCHWKQPKNPNSQHFHSLFIHSKQLIKSKANRFVTIYPKSQHQLSWGFSSRFLILLSDISKEKWKTAQSHILQRRVFPPNEKRVFHKLKCGR